MKDEFNICNTKFLFNISGLNKVFRMNMNKVGVLVDFDNKEVIKLSKSKGRMKICNTSNKINRLDIIPYLKSNYEFMSQIISIIKLINRNYCPRSFDFSDVTGESAICNSNSSNNLDIVMKWTWDKHWDDNKILITIF